MDGNKMQKSTKNYVETLNILSSRYDEINGYDFYREIFPNNQNAGEYREDIWQTNAVYLYRDENIDNPKRRLTRRIMLNDTWEQDYIDYVEKNPMTLCSGLTYRGKANTLNNARQMNALIFDLDGVGENELEAFLWRAGGDPKAIRRLPIPTYLVISGSGLHVYYVFDEPIDLYPNIKLQLKRFKYDLTFRMWDYRGTSQIKEIQYQSINQGFRMVGSINERYGTELRAFCIGEKVTLDYINPYAQYEENQVDINRPFRPTKITKLEAAEKYPEWYQRVVVEGNRRPKKWDIGGQKGHRGDELYNWWLEKAPTILGGHRYYFMMCLAIYACKCDISKKRLREDMQSAFNILREIDHTNQLVQEDVESAMEAYDKDYYNFTIDDIEYLTNVRITKNKRNGRTKDEHLLRARAVQEVDYPNGSWRNKKGRASKAHVVKEWRKSNPKGTKAACIRDTGLSKPTVYKYWL